MRTKPESTIDIRYAASSPVTPWCAARSSASPTPRQQAGRRAAFLAAMLAVCLAAGWGCGAFKPREPEPPEGSQPIILLSQPDSVYVSMQTGLTNKYIQTYINVFDPDLYTFHPDEQDSLDLIADGTGDVFNVLWNRQVEEQVTSSIFGTVGLLDLRFIGPAIDSVNTVSSEVLFIRKEYELHADEAIYKGQAAWTMVRQGGEWRITNWQDIRLTQGWGVLKGRNR